MKAIELGFKLNAEAPETRSITAEVKRLEGLGYEYEAAEASLALLIAKTLAHRELPFKVDGYHVSIRSHNGSSVCEATVKVCVGGKTSHTVAEGDGPVNALDSALRAAWLSFSRTARCSVDRLQGPHSRWFGGYRRQDPRIDHFQRRQAGVGHCGREREHHFGQPPGAGG